MTKQTVVDLPQIKYFFAVCEARGFTRAAALCGISQPSLSVAIRRLEEELGGCLFDRGPQLRLSPLGAAVKPHFEAIQREVEKILQIRADAYNGAALQVRGVLPKPGGRPASRPYADEGE